MGFWVEVENKKTSRQKVRRFDTALLAMGKRVGLSFAEINELSVQDLLDFVGDYTGAGDEDEGPQMATQEDIDRFYSGL